MHSVHLIRHPATPFSDVNHIGAQVRLPLSDAIEIEFALAGDIEKLRIPAENAARRADNLWQHTCFEAFIGAPNRTAYVEFNFAPSGEWAIYQFEAYRQGMSIVTAPPPVITTRRTANNLLLKAVVNLREFPELKDRAELRLALSAVIENIDGELSYWALAHPPGKPDFHHADSFALTLNRLKNSK